MSEVCPKCECTAGVHEVSCPAGVKETLLKEIEALPNVVVEKSGNPEWKVELKAKYTKDIVEKIKKI